MMTTEEDFYEDDVYTRMECAAYDWAADAAPQFAGDMQISEAEALERCYSAKMSEYLAAYRRTGQDPTTEERLT